MPLVRGSRGGFYRDATGGERRQSSKSLRAQERPKRGGLRQGRYGGGDRSRSKPNQTKPVQARLGGARSSQTYVPRARTHELDALSTRSCNQRATWSPCTHTLAIGAFACPCPHDSKPPRTPSIHWMRMSGTSFKSQPSIRFCSNRIPAPGTPPLQL